MTMIVFTGPSLPPEQAGEHLAATFLPPAAVGDIYRAARTGPRAIGLIDGFFERVPSVWHKEVLFAMNEGVVVFGAASMGALRAAELAQFGMHGVGKIFEAYRSGALEDDDEVAVIHGPAEFGYPCLSEAMVNIRCTLARAVACGVISQGTGTKLERAAKQLHYRDRNFGVLIRSAHDEDVAPSDLRAFAEWLPTGRVDQKRDDAIAMLRAMRDLVEREDRPGAPAFHFERTTLWERATRLAEASLVG